MAERRMISKCISISEKVNSLPDVFDMLLYTWIIPHSDDFGRMPGSAAKIKALVVPMLDKSMKDVEQAIIHLHDAELIQWYEVDGTKYIQINNFDEHQTGLHKRTKSKFPEPPISQSTIPNDSEKFTEIPRNSPRSEGKGIEQNGSEEKETPNVFSRYQEIFGFMGSLDTQILESYLKDGMEEKVILEAFDRTLRKAENPKFSYAKSILNNWINRGLKTLEQVNERDPINKKVIPIEKQYREVSYIEPPDLLAGDWK